MFISYHIFNLEVLVLFLAREHRRAQWRRHNKSDKGRASLKRYEATPKAKRREKRYAKTAKSKLRYIKYYKNHHEQVTRTQSNYNASKPGKSRHKAWQKRNPEKMRKIWNAAGKRRYATERGRLIVNARNRIRSAVASQGVKMPASASKLIGCDWDTLRRHLESKFVDGMTWKNYGKWHVDHIDPIDGFDLTDSEQVARCFSWRNLQPLWGVDNLRKGSKPVQKLTYIKKS